MELDDNYQKHCSFYVNSRECVGVAMDMNVWLPVKVAVRQG